MPPDAPIAEDLVDIRLPGGQAGTVPRADLNQALAAHASLMTPEEVQADAKEAAPTTFTDVAMGAKPYIEAANAVTGLGLGGGNPLSGLALGGRAAPAYQEGAFEGATAGLGPAAVHAGLGMLSPEAAKAYSEHVAGQKKEFAGAHGLGVAGGMIGAALTAKGAGGALKLAPSALLGEMGTGVAGQFGKTVAGRVIGAGVGAAVEQEGYNIGTQFSEDELGDHGHNAEHLLANAAPSWDVLLAGGLGAGGAGLGTLWKAGRGSTEGILGASKLRSSGATADAVTGVAGTGRAVEAEAKAATDAVDRMSVNGLPRDQGREVFSQIDQAAKAEAQGQKGILGSVMDGLEALHGHDPALVKDLQAIRAGRLSSAVEQAEVMDGNIKRLMGSGNDALAHGFAASDEIAFGLKHEQVLKNIDATKHMDIVDAANQMTRDADEWVAHWSASESKGGGANELGKFKKLLADAKGTIAKAAEVSVASGQAPNAKAAALAYLEMDNLKRGMQKIAKFGRPVYGQAPIAIATDRALLDGGRNWGADSVSEGWRKSLEDASLFGKVGDIQAANNSAFSNGASNRFKFEREMTTSRYNEMGRPINEMNSESIAAFLKKAGSGAAGETPRLVVKDAIENQIAVIDAITAHSTIDSAQAARLAKGRAALLDMRAAVDDTVASSEQLGKLQQRIDSEQGIGMGGGFMGAASDAVLRPATKMQQLMLLQKKVAAGKDAIKGSIKGGLFGGGAKAEGAAVRATPYRGNAAEEIAAVKQAAANPEELIGRTQRMIGQDLPGVAPKTTAEVGGVAARAIAYLAKQAPLGSQPTGFLAGKQPRRYSDMEIHQWQRTVEAIKDPAEFVRKAEHGGMSREGVHALAAVYPKIYEEMRQHVIDQVHELEQKGTLDKMPYQQKLMMGVLLDAPMDGTMAQPFLAEMQAAKQAAPDKPQGPGGGGGPRQVGHRPMDMNTSIFQTDANAPQGVK